MRFGVQMRLKRKYRTRNEPDHWKGRSHVKFANIRGGGHHSNNGGTKKFKGIKPLGFSGRTCGRMVRRHDAKAKR